MSDPAYDPTIHGPFAPQVHPDLDAAAESVGFTRCISCGTLPVTHTRGRFQNNQHYAEWDNALLIDLRGGYGMFFDDHDQGPKSAALCHDCAHSLCDTVPWLAALLNPAKSHAHTQAYTDANPDHYGWDYDLRANQ